MRGPRMGSRAELTAALDSLQQFLPIADGDSERRVRQEIAGIGRRLREGDVWPGDVIDLAVGGQPRWTGQFTVTPTRTLELPDIDPIDLSGVLLSELEEALSSQFARYLQEPRVQVRVLKRVGVTGNVGSPGFYTVDGSSLVSDVVMVAGGPQSSAKIDKIKFRRLGDDLRVGDQVVWQSLSLDELGIQSGDELYVPGGGIGIGKILLGVLTTGSLIAFSLARIF